MTRTIKTLRRQIQKLRERKNPLTWVEVCERLKIHGAGGVSDPGMASLIAYGRKGVPYEPSDPETRKRLGLSIVCKECRRPLRGGKPKVEKTVEPDCIVWWKGLGVFGRHSEIRKAHTLYLKENG